MATNAFNELRQAILDKVTSEGTTIQEAYFSEQEKFNGSPAVVIGVSQNEALYNSQKTDSMTFVFNVRIYIPYTTSVTSEQVETQMGQAYWDILTIFNKRSVLNPFCDFVEPLPSTWGFEERAGAIMRYAEINIRCRLYLKS